MLVPLDFVVGLNFTFGHIFNFEVEGFREI